MCVRLGRLDFLDSVRFRFYVFEKFDQWVGDEAQDTATKLRALIKSYKERRDSVRQQLPLINRELDGIMASLECETNGNLKAQEARIRVNEQNIFKLNEFIRKRSQESNYTDLKKKCMSLVQEINQEVIRSHRETWRVWLDLDTLLNNDKL